MVRGDRMSAHNYEYQFPNTPPRKADPTQLFVMKKVFGHDMSEVQSLKTDTDYNEWLRVVRHHWKLSEQIVGGILEYYIAETLEPYGLVWHPEQAIEATDFSFLTEDGEKIQVNIKNSNTSENSSSMGYRELCEVIKWSRYNSHNGKTNWEKFPFPKGRELLSEEGFRKYLLKKYHEFKSNQV